MLETIREYAGERLDLLADADDLRRRHAEYYLAVAESAEPHLTASTAQASWLERLDAEHENLRLALDHFRRARAGEEQLRLVGALGRFWYLRGHLREGRSRATDALAAHGGQSLSRVKALYAASVLSHRLGDDERADAFAQERLDLARRLGDPEQLAGALVGLGVGANGVGDAERDLAATSEGAELARACGFLWILGVATRNLGSSAQELGNYPQAQAHLEESLDIFKRLGAEKYIAETCCELGVVAARGGKNDQAEALFRRSIERAGELLDNEVAIWCMGELAALAALRGDAERSAKLVGAVEILREQTGHAPTPDERRIDEQTRSALVTELDGESLAAALASGREMPLEQAVAFALDPTTPH